MRNPRIGRLLAICALATFVAAGAQGRAAAATLVVTDAMIEGGKLIVRGTAPRANQQVTLDNRFTKTSTAAKAFVFALDDYHPSACIVDLAAGAQTATAVVANCGERGVSPRGAWRATTPYLADDLATFRGSTWRARRDNTGKRPDLNARLWQLFAAKGVSGAAGPRGPRGLTGEAGPQGDKGPRGQTGATGSQGPAGPQGLEGPQGPVGPQGPAGPQGPEGPQGPAGPQGQSAGGTILSARVGTDGTLLGGRGATGSVRDGTGSYSVVFNQSIDVCHFVASSLYVDTRLINPIVPVLRLNPTEPNTIVVNTLAIDTDSPPFDSAFNLLVFCPTPPSS